MIKWIMWEVPREIIFRWLFTCVIWSQLCGYVFLVILFSQPYTFGYVISLFLVQDFIYWFVLRNL